MADKAVVLVRMPLDAAATSGEKFEKDKAKDFINALLGWGYLQNNIVLLAENEAGRYPFTPNGAPTWTNFKAALDALQIRDPENENVVVYITEHTQIVETEDQLRLDMDKKLPEVANELQQVYYTADYYVISNGRGAYKLANGIHRTNYVTMASYTTDILIDTEPNKDQFNIGIKMGQLPPNYFIQAFHMEKDRLRGTQDPEIWIYN